MSGVTRVGWHEQPSNAFVADILLEIWNLRWSDQQEKLGILSPPTDPAVETLMLALGFKQADIKDAPTEQVIRRGPSFNSERSLRCVGRMLAAPRSGGALQQLASAGTSDLSERQEEFAVLQGWTVVKSGGKHAEIALLRHCADHELSPWIVGTENAACPDCRRRLAAVCGLPPPSRSHPCNLLEWTGRHEVVSHNAHLKPARPS